MNKIDIDNRVKTIIKDLVDEYKLPADDFVDMNNDYIVSAINFLLRDNHDHEDIEGAFMAIRLAMISIIKEVYPNEYDIYISEHYVHFYEYEETI